MHCKVDLLEHGHGPVTIGELEHACVGLAVSFDVVLYEIHSAPLQILAGGSARCKDSLL